MPTPLTLTSPEITARLERMSLAEKVRLLTGRDFWTTWPVESAGLRRLLVSDGPSGVRGEVWDERSPSLNLPSATALSSSWDPALARRYGTVTAQEALRKGVDVVLGPTINLHRSPLGGRHFEAYSEDPLLSGDIAAAYVAGVQECGVGATPKHYVANDYETDRFTASTEVSERALRELYLLPFEKAVTEGGAWLVMSAYNGINGTTATEHDLLRTPLTTEWGFDGVVISDWTAVRSLRSAEAGQDLVMPGPDGPWGDALLAAVRAGTIPEEVVDEKVRRLLLLAARVGGLDKVEAQRVEVADVDGRAFAREAAAEGTVLLANDGVLPLTADALTRVAVVGHNAALARTQGGGSATVVPERVVSPLDGLRAALPDAEVAWAMGAVVQQGIAELPADRIVNPSTGRPGARMRFLDADGRELFAEDRFATSLTYFGGAAPTTTAARVELTTRWTPDRDGEARLGFSAAAHGSLAVDGSVVLDATPLAQGDDLGAAILSPGSASAAVAVAAGVPLELTLTVDLPGSDVALTGLLRVVLGTEPDARDPEALLAEATSLAADAQVAVVVVGTSSEVESEGFDRTDLRLPGRQDDLVRAVVATGTPTIVVVNAGSPVELPWRHDVAAVVLTYFGGQEMGHALADVLLGLREPGGRLPTTWPATLADAPVQDVTPQDGRLEYREGIHIGYRAWLRHDAEPAYPFGFGLGYTTWAVGDLTAPDAVEAGDAFEVTLTATNTGERAGKTVVQVYLSRARSDVDRPARWLAGHAVVRAAAGASVRVTVPVAARALAHWSDDGWAVEPGAFRVHAGADVLRLPLAADVVVTSAG